MTRSQTAPDFVANFQLSAANFDAISALALREFGLSLPSSKHQLVQSRLARRLRVLNLPNFEMYQKLLEGPAGAQEQSHLLSALTTNVTKFFREIHHFEILLSDIMPELIKKARNGERVRLWSAGCSSGQEPYSIAMTALKCDSDIGQYDFKILATDIDPVIIEKAKTAIYSLEEINSISPEFFRSADIVQTASGENNVFSPSPDVKSLVTFGVLNLIAELPFSGSFDVIFCRNVAIYFDHQTQQRVWRCLADRLPLDGKLFIGHSERIKSSEQPNLKSNGITVYKKI